jgi:hypothetical protein
LCLRVLRLQWQHFSEGNKEPNFTQENMGAWA